MRTYGQKGKRLQGFSSGAAFFAISASAQLAEVGAFGIYINGVK